MSTLKSIPKPTLTQAPEVHSEPIPTNLEGAERRVLFRGFVPDAEQDPLQVTVAAEQTARLLLLAIQGTNVELQADLLEERDADLLAEVAAQVWIFCKQAKALVPGGHDPAYTVPAA